MIVPTRNLQALARAASQAAERAVFAELSTRFQQAIRTPAYSWPRNTLRQSGQLVGSPRDIVDTGTLARQQQSPQVTGSRAIYRWTAPYSPYVHEGVRLRGGGIMPARPWTGAVLGTEPISGIPAYDIRARFRQEWLQTFNRR